MNESQNAIPHLFRCPISLDLLEDPVTLCTGQTYDRSNIEKWLALGNLTCPVTMQKLHDPSIVPNHTLRHLIDQWLQLCHQFDPANPEASTIDSLASLKSNIESHESSLENKFQALGKISLLSDEYCSFNKSCFFQLDFLPQLLELVFGTQVSPEIDMNFIELALCCIKKLLPLGSLEPLNMIKDGSKLTTFVLLFEKGTNSVKTSLCRVIESSSSSSETEDLCSTLGNSHKLVHEIVQVVNQNYEVSGDAIKAILVRGGAIEEIMRYITSERRNMAPVAMRIIEKVMWLKSAKEALVKHPNGVQTMVNMVFRVSDQECSESAVEVLLTVCGEFERAREEAIESGVLTRLLLLLQSQCSNPTKSKARMLLKLLRS
uniref:U-box domain-containing protein n=1 Tax=Glycine max TaxID=3847 RepID=K7KR67_SOYBN